MVFSCSATASQANMPCLPICTVVLCGYFLDLQDTFLFSFILTLLFLCCNPPSNYPHPPPNSLAPQQISSTPFVPLFHLPLSHSPCLLTCLMVIVHGIRTHSKKNFKMFKYFRTQYIIVACLVGTHLICSSTPDDINISS